jgi:hypothetical protein
VSLWLIRLALNGATAVPIDAACWRFATRQAKAFAVVTFLVLAPFSYWSIHNWYVVTGRSKLFTSQWIQEPSTSRAISI